MNATILPADEMINVLSDAIRSKTDTITTLEAATKAATADRQRLRQARAIHLARQAGFRLGDVWLCEIDNRHRAAILAEITPAYGFPDDASVDWRLVFLSKNESYGRAEKQEITTWRCEGRIDSGRVVEDLQKLLREQTAKEVKAA